MLFELRQYTINEGRREEFVNLMEEKIIPFQTAQGMTILGSFVSEEDEQTYVWIRRFHSEDERERLYDAVYNSDYWRDEIAPSVGDMMSRESISVKRLEATPRSPIQ
ncbi:MAG: NIPSNAP family protein [Chloroflexi bacterium]|nr:NIPSNAP family protein [Chloroflexota bacterium]MCY3697381.1 NIPSNAP family protein [Chloroflexota bacterium]MXX31915.1 NIPSNAP family containing protein [Chloroflexota bacterium]MXX81209.1 NIPSNAP family containing protein [Chloroflexota bacterium]MYB22821.1 NIPSNAP family containing protein [Chloroflexota bacterium]